MKSALNLIFSDGAASGNPGPSGWAFLACLRDLGQVIELGSHVPRATNNQMEMRAAVEALRLCNKSKLKSEVQIYTDSKYLIEGITKWIHGWKRRDWVKADGQPVANKELWIELEEQLNSLSVKVHWNYVPGHAGVPGNERVDEIAVAFSKNQDPDLYDGSISDYPCMRYFEVEGEVKVDRYDKPKYLALIKGNFHLFDTWPECQQAVKGQSGVKFKKVQTKQEEQTLREKWLLLT